MEEESLVVDKMMPARLGKSTVASAAVELLRFCRQQDRLLQRLQMKSSIVREHSRFLVSRLWEVLNEKVSKKGGSLSPKLSKFFNHLVSY